MRFKYSTTHPNQNELDSLPRVPMTLNLKLQVLEVMCLVDSGASINVLPFSVGQQLGAIWNPQRAIIRLAGNLSKSTAQPLILNATLGNFPSVRLAFAWVQHNETPVILGQTNFFSEFDICFFRSIMEFEVKPKQIPIKESPPNPNP